MRSVFVFPAGERAETVAVLEALSPQRRPWVVADALYIDIVDEHHGHLFTDWEAGEVATLEAAVGHRPAWAVQVDISGRIDGTAEVHQLLAVLLEHGGVVMDDYSDRAWTLPEIQSGAAVNGVRFFDFRRCR